MAVVATLSKGYDLEYIWKQVDRGPVKDAAGYYLQASEGGGEPPGRWGARARRRSAWSPDRSSSAGRMTCRSGSAKPRTAPRWASLQVAAGRRGISTPGCWPPGRMLDGLLGQAARTVAGVPGRPRLRPVRHEPRRRRSARVHGRALLRPSSGDAPVGAAAREAGTRQVTGVPEPALNGAGGEWSARAGPEAIASSL